MEKQINSIQDILENDPLGVLGGDGDYGIFDLKHVPAVPKKRKTFKDFVAQRTRCREFQEYKGLFLGFYNDFYNKKIKLQKCNSKQEIKKGMFFEMKGIVGYVAEVESVQLRNGKLDNRLICIFENGTESNMLRSSLLRWLPSKGRVAQNV